ncbi:MAG: hypothetical protein DWQ06_06650 [Calditrichaeota bacterium]|nr:MAG: hypothetical protein DWQ06_06650 [Calditrichota bacterium]
MLEIKEEKHFLTHQLTPLFGEISKFKQRKNFENSPLYAKLKNQISEVVNGIEWDNSISKNCETKEKIRVVAWNIERGKNLKGIIWALQNESILAEADILLLSEVDNGMGRSQNKNVAREIALALQMNYCFANSYLVLSKGTHGETSHKIPNSLGLHGSAILSKFKITHCENAILSILKDKFTSSEKRLGSKKSCVAKIQIGEKSLGLGVAHLDSGASPKQRAEQLQGILESLGKTKAETQIIGGDFNTTTWDFSNYFSTVREMLYKGFIFGIDETIENYLVPFKRFEKPIFDKLNEYGYNFKDFNEEQKGTLFFEVADEIASKKALELMPKFLLNYAKKRLAKWDGKIPMKLDWFAVKSDLEDFKRRKKNIFTKVIETQDFEGLRISDHIPLVLDLNI